MGPWGTPTFLEEVVEAKPGEAEMAEWKSEGWSIRRAGCKVVKEKKSCRRERSEKGFPGAPEAW